MPRWEGKLAPVIPDNCHFSWALGGREVQSPTWSKGFPISRNKEGIDSRVISHDQVQQILQPQENLIPRAPFSLFL